MKRFKLYGIIVFSVVSLVLATITVSAQAQQNVINLRYAHFMPSVTKQAQLAEQWCKEVESRTNGRVKITFYPGGTLINAPLMYDGIVKGIADIGWSFLAYTRGKFPLSEVVDLPLGYKSGYVATRLANEFYKEFKPKELEDVKVMYLHAHGPGILLTAKKPVHNLEDLKGIKIRATGLSAKIVQALGGAPVGMPISDAYDALRTGVVEGISVTIEALQQWKLADYIKYVTENYGSAYTTTGFCVMNKNKWNSLPPDVQKIIEDINKEWIEKTGQLWDQLDKEGRVFAQNKGVKFIHLSKEEDEKWASRVRPILDDYVKSMQTKNLPGDKALKFCIDYLKKNQ